MKTLPITCPSVAGLGSASLAALLLLAPPARAAVTNIPCNPADYTCQATGVNNPIASSTDAIGFAGSPGSTWCAILMFPLPTLPAGKAIGPQTSLTVALASVGASTTINADVWGVANFRDTLPAGTPDSTYYYYLGNDTGPGANPTATDAKLFNNFLTPILIGQAGAIVTTPTGTTNNLRSYIQGFYTSNPTYDASVSQAYVWLRLNPDASSSSTANRYVINAGDSGVSVGLRPTLNLDIVDQPANALVWNGNASAVWDINGAANWKSNGVPGFTYQDGAAVSFDDTLSGNPAITLDTTVSPSSVTVNGATGFSISGSGNISGAASLVKTGPGTLILDTDNDYAGGTALAGGTLQVGNGDTHGSLGSAPLTNIVSGTVLAFNRTDALTVNTITRNYFYSATVKVNSGTFSLGGDGDNSGTLATVANGATLILAKTSSGAAHALGSSSTVNAGGTLRLGGTGGDQLYQGVFLTNNGVFDMAGLNEGINGLVGSGLVTNSSATAATLALGDGGGTAVFNGRLVDGAGTLAVTKTGAGTQTLAGTNAYSGATTVSAGKLVVTTGSSSGSHTVADTATLGVSIVAPNGSYTAGGVTFGNSKLELQNLNSTTTAPLVATNLVLNGTLTINITSTNVLLPATAYPVVAYTTRSGGGGFALGTLPAGVSGTLDTSGSPIKFVVASVPVTWNGNVSGVWDIDTTPNWKFGTITGLKYPDGDAVTFNDTLSGTSAITLDTVVSPLSVLCSNNTRAYSISGGGYITGPAMLTKTGTNVLILDTDNDYSGGTIMAGGTLQVGNGDTHGTLGSGPVTNLVGGAIIAFNRTDTLSVNTITRTTVDNSARLVINSGTVSLEGLGDNAGTIATVNSGATLILAKSSSPTVHALSSFAPFLLINPGGLMQVGSFGDDQIYKNSGLTDNGIFDLASHNEGFDMLNGSGVVTNSAGGVSTLQLGENNGSSTFAGSIANGVGDLALTKVGTGTLVLTGPNSYSGDTLVSAGELVVATASSGAGNYTVADSAALGVIVAGPDGSLRTSGLYLGAASTSTLEFQNLNSTTTPAMQAAILNVNSAVTINVLSGAFAAGQVYPLLSYSSLFGGGSFALGTLPAGVSATLDTAASPLKLHVTSSVNLTPTNLVASLQNGALELQWPADHTGWLVESNSLDLTVPGDWFVVPGSDATNSLTIPIGSNPPHVFYRLRY